MYIPGRSKIRSRGCALRDSAKSSKLSRRNVPPLSPAQPSPPAGRAQASPPNCLLQLQNNSHRTRCVRFLSFVRAKGFEPLALPTSRGCSTTELSAQREANYTKKVFYWQHATRR